MGHLGMDLAAQQEAVLVKGSIATVKLVTVKLVRLEPVFPQARKTSKEGQQRGYPGETEVRHRPSIVSSHSSCKGHVLFYSLIPAKARMTQALIYWQNNLIFAHVFAYVQLLPE